MGATAVFTELIPGAVDRIARGLALIAVQRGLIAGPLGLFFRTPEPIPERWALIGGVAEPMARADEPMAWQPELILRAEARLLRTSVRMKFIASRNGKRNLVCVEKSRLAWKTCLIACQGRHASGMSEPARDGCLPDSRDRKK